MMVWYGTSGIWFDLNDINFYGFSKSDIGVIGFCLKIKMSKRVKFDLELNELSLDTTGA